MVLFAQHNLTNCAKYIKVAELQYEIDSEGVAPLDEYAEKDERLTWSQTQPIGVSMTEHFQSFTRMLERARTIIYERTRKFVPNLMICARNVIEVLSFINGWKPATVSTVAGPYFAGSVNGIKVYVSPQLHNGEYIIACKGNDMATAPAVA